MTIISNKPGCKSTLISFIYMAFCMEEILAGRYMPGLGEYLRREGRRDLKAIGWGKSAVKCCLLDITWTHKLIAAKVACTRHTQDQARL